MAPKKKKAATEEKKEKVRLQFEFTEEALARLKALQSSTDAVTKAEVIRNALRVYEWLVQKDTEDYAFQIVKDGQATQLELFARPK